MKAIRMKQKLILSALAGAILVPGSAITVRAADNSTENTPVIPVAGIESAVKECYQSEVKENIDLYLVPNNEGEYLNMAFSNVSDYAYIRNAPVKQVTGSASCTAIRRQKYLNIMETGQGYGPVP